MYNKKYILLLIMIAAFSIGCGTSGLEVDQEAMEFSNFGAFIEATEDGIPVNQPFSFVLDIENAPASDITLTNFTEGGTWLQAELINDGTQVELSGTPETADGFGYSLAASDPDKVNAYTTFEIEAFSPES